MYVASAVCDSSLIYAHAGLPLLVSVVATREAETQIPSSGPQGCHQSVTSGAPGRISARLQDIQYPP